MEEVAKTLVFFTTANPPTGLNGQVGIIQHFVKRYDRIVIRPLRKHPRDETKNVDLVDYQHRVNMSRLAFEKLSPTVIVESIEEEVEAKGFLDLIDESVCKEIIGEPSMLMGSDQYTGFYNKEMQPRGIEEVEALVASVEVVARKGAPSSPFLLARSASPAADAEDFDNNDIERLFVPTYLHYPQALTIPASSSATRASRRANTLFDLVTPDVLRYIERNRLYAFGLHKTPLNRPIKEIPRNPSIDVVATLRSQIVSLMPKDVLATVVPVLQDGFHEMLKREVSDQEIAWLASYLRDHNPMKMDPPPETQASVQ